MFEKSLKGQTLLFLHRKNAGTGFGSEFDKPNNKLYLFTVFIEISNTKYLKL